MVNEVFNVSAEFDTCCQVIVVSGVTRPYLDLILGKSVPNLPTPIFGDRKYALLAPLSTYGRCFGKCSSADCKDVAVERDLPCALVARAFPFAAPNKKGTPTPIIRLLALVWHAYGAVESWCEDRTVMLRFPSSEPSAWGECTATGGLGGVKVTAHAPDDREAVQTDKRAQQAEGVQVLYVILRKTFFVRRKKRSFEHSNLRTKIVFEVFYHSTAQRLQQRKPAPLASGGSCSYQVVELRRP